MKNQKLVEILAEYLTETTRAILEKNRKGAGKEILGEVINRPDDLEIGIDRIGEQIIEQLLKKHSVRATIFSEPANGNIAIGEPPDFYGSLDPFDNSILFLKGFRHTWYTALSFFDMQGAFLAGCIGDILNKSAWISSKETGAFLFDLESGNKTALVSPLQNTPPKTMVFASYLMSSHYSIKFLHAFWNFIKAMDPKALLYPFGGAHIYGFLADGRVDAYVMFDEPRSEIDPGFGIAKRAGCFIGEVDLQGNWRDYEFIPGKQHGTVGLLVAARTKELRDEIVNYYKQTIQKQ